MRQGLGNLPGVPSSAIRTIRGCLVMLVQRYYGCKPLQPRCAREVACPGLLFSFYRRGMRSLGSSPLCCSKVERFINVLCLRTTNVLFVLFVPCASILRVFSPPEYFSLFILFFFWNLKARMKKKKRLYNDCCRGMDYPRIRARPARVGVG